MRITQGGSSPRLNPHSNRPTTSSGTVAQVDSSEVSNSWSDMGAIPVSRTPDPLAREGSGGASASSRPRPRSLRQGNAVHIPNVGRCGLLDGQGWLRAVGLQPRCRALGTEQSPETGTRGVPCASAAASPQEFHSLDIDASCIRTSVSESIPRTKLSKVQTLSASSLTPRFLGHFTTPGPKQRPANSQSRKQQ